eukprot:CAMPEP_0119103072 /NCGR_PEP_ID=MMETSP1180-20130426/1619_1 /TAXON_ID=3052 ORGANISM="Chlamydomonas cf sp, Strain CCMP681" /NCGR_SAMPLE_ID=MMETSP1180 /ASSEMBLY_ACC=CAM_ASM_000741 /LENGTH=88 /DNA_ID=CAMNT_0007087499 /DNA_START=1755 /DNA_END=2017 /DNA_ORIENTATION=+
MPHFECKPYLISVADFMRPASGPLRLATNAPPGPHAAMPLAKMLCVVVRGEPGTATGRLASPVWYCGNIAMGILRGCPLGASVRATPA